MATATKKPLRAADVRDDEMTVLREELAATATKISDLQTKLMEMEVDRTKLQSENHILRGELDTLRQKISENETFSLHDHIARLEGRQNELITAFTVHMNANTTAINALTATVANLKVGK